MRRFLCTALIFSLAACASTPTPAVRAAPPVATTELTPTTTTEPVVTDAGAPMTATTEPADAGPGEVTPSAADAGATTAIVTPPTTPPTIPHPTAPAGGNAVAQGRVVFQRVCLRCHEDNNSDGPHPNLRWPEARVRTLVRNGNARMRAIPTSRLSDADLALLVSYLRSTHAIQ